MSLTGWLIFIIVVQVIHFFGTWKLYERAGKKWWQALIPIYNGIVLMEIINRPKWWVILLFIPIINLLMFPIIWIETCRSFGFNKQSHTILAVITLGFFIYYINYFTDAKHIEDRSLVPRTALGEWVSSIAFAIIVSTLVHTYFIQPYVIPTSSLEKTLLIGDYLFVSKFHYGARVPKTTVALPMLHDSIPFTGVKSYVSDDKPETFKSALLNKLQLPYLRFPGFKKIKRNEIVVFSWPTDTLVHWTKPELGIVKKPIDKKTNYVKRCVAIPGDTLEVRNGYVYIDGKRSKLPPSAKPQWMFKVSTGGRKFSQSTINRYNIREGYDMGNGNYLLNLTDSEAAEMAKNPIVETVEKRIAPEGKGYYDPNIFPHSPKYPWSVDNFGPIYLPEKGATVKLDANSILFYKQIIGDYEGNDLVVFEDKIYINGKLADSYTFKQDYYWMMGDNRQNSLDARAWGYVPFDHIVGTPIMIWFSKDNLTGNIRWDRIFTTVSATGKTKSYFWPGIIISLIVLFLVFKPKRKKKKE